MNIRILAAVLITGVLCAEAAAQEDGLNVSLRVNHGAAYRDGTWVPIDVIVDNRAKDIQGWIEISLFNANGDVQSPRYRVPAESAKFSVKRFRLHCRLTGVDRIRAQIYHKKRAVLDIPLVVQVRPIAQQDFLCLVLDDKAENFGFLSTALYRGMGQNVRFHRESLDTSQLTFLADHQVCYEPFNLIVMGEIDPSRISARHRELLMGYVEQGGTLVVALGANAGLYRGTWVEDWLGVTIGTSSVYNGVELAKGAYNGDVEGARPEREAFVTQMLPHGDDVLFRKDVHPLLEVSRPYGAGYVLALAIDAESQVLHRHPEFHAFWRRVAEQAYRPVSLNYGGAASLAAAQLPRVAGVELFPVSSVILYLVLYFTIAIVGNWLFWNYFKRRELAWVCLVVFSFGFTGYAMIFGTQGRAKATEIERLEVLELPGNASAGTLRSLTGILAAGSGYYSGNLGGPGVLAADLQLDGGFQFARGNRPRRFSGPQPFTFIQDGQGHIGNLRIGASEMRFLDITKTIRFDGAITGELVDDEGHVYGTLENNTGLDFSEIRLYHNGMLYRLNTIESGWEIDTAIHPAEAITTGQLQQFNQYGRSTTSMMQFRQRFRDALLADPNASFQTQISSPYGGGYGSGKGDGYDDGLLMKPEVVANSH